MIIAVQLFSQYSISNTSYDFYDEERTRWIETFVYYPSVIDSGTSETFPFIVLGHGFSMSYSSYSYLWEHLVPQGYIVILPNTETGVFGVDHGDFGNDLGFLAGHFYEQSLDVESDFYNNVEPFPAVIGHSMGGGATHLAAEGYTGDIGTAISFAAAETDPSAIDAAANADIPLYIFYGEVDAVSPPDENQILIYNNSNSSCKTMINILGGGHCYFADSDFVCDIADSSPYEIEREEQHDIVTDFLDLILDYELNGNQVSECLLTDSLENSPRIEYQRSCMMMEYSINASSNPAAGGTIAGAGNYEACSTATLTATANVGYEFVNWTENGTEISQSATIDIDVLANRTLVANYSELVGIQTNNKETITCYPNPASDFLEIDNISNQVEIIRIRNLDGKLLYESGRNNRINISYLPQGVYFIEFLDGNGMRIATQKIQTQ